MESFYNLAKDRGKGFLSLPVGLIIFIVIAVLYFNKSGDIKQYIDNIVNPDYENISLSTLISYANFSNRKNVCTEGYHIKSNGLTVLKEKVDRDLYNNSVWMAFDEDKESFFDSYFSSGKSAKVRVCGFFESKLGDGFGPVGVFNHQITTKEYDLLSNPEFY